MNEGTRIRLGLITKSYDRRLREATGSDADWLVELDVVFVRTLRPAMAEIGAELTRAGHACQIQSGHVEGMPSLDWTVEPRGAAEGKRMIRVFPRKDERKGWEILAEVWLSGTPRELTRFKSPKEVTAEVAEQLLVDAVEQVLAAAASTCQKPEGL